jgi:hypothetical protein
LLVDPPVPLGGRAVIGLAVLAAGALRKATVPEFVASREFPQEGILLYGASFTGLLLLSSST